MQCVQLIPIVMGGLSPSTLAHSLTTLMARRLHVCGHYIDKHAMAAPRGGTTSVRPEVHGEELAVTTCHMIS